MFGKNRNERSSSDRYSQDRYSQDRGSQDRNQDYDQHDSFTGSRGYQGYEDYPGTREGRKDFGGDYGQNPGQGQRGQYDSNRSSGGYMGRPGIQSEASGGGSQDRFYRSNPAMRESSRDYQDYGSSSASGRSWSGTDDGASQGYGSSQGFDRHDRQQGQGYGQSFGQSIGQSIGQQQGYGQSRGMGASQGSYGAGSYGAGMYGGPSYGGGSSYGHSTQSVSLPDDRRHYGKGPKGYKRSDERIHEEVCELLTSHYDIDASEVEVEVKDGVVTLTGTVESRRTKRMAEDVVADMNGVQDVKNNLRVLSHDSRMLDSSSDGKSAGYRSASASTDSTLSGSSARTSSSKNSATDSKSSSTTRQ